MRNKKHSLTSSSVGGYGIRSIQRIFGFQKVTRHEKSMDEDKSFFEHMAERYSCRDWLCTSASRISRETGSSEFLDSGADAAETKKT
ncbi:hypothetical protein [Paraburkholderia humisilvae]|uniref:hypothetical protein n=1 Tax=Paraburkholderia humisilvae TaxID=627669 RepID=UPI0015819BFC|nr:hypothetical protein [Paraburkholderia humisilvae]